MAHGARDLITEMKYLPLCLPPRESALLADSSSGPGERGWQSFVKFKNYNLDEFVHSLA